MSAHRIDLVVCCLFISLLLFGCAQQTADKAPSKALTYDEIYENPPTEYKIVYKYSVVHPKTNDLVTITQNWYLKPPKYRLKQEFVKAGKPVVWDTYFLDKVGNYFCNNETGTMQCERTAEPQSDRPAVPPSIAGPPLSGIRHLYDVTNLEMRSYANLPAYCFKAVPKPHADEPTKAKGDLEICASERGVSLYLKQIKIGGTQLTYEAISYSDNISDFDFELPAEIPKK